MIEPVSIVEGWCPGAIGDIAALHGRHYARDWGFGVYFEAKVARELAGFVSPLPDQDCGLWLARDGSGRILGAVALDGREPDGMGRAHLRWFILDDAARGKGLGARLLDQAVAFGRHRRISGIYLWTFAGLDAARGLYESRGFTLVEQRSGDTWGTPVTEQRFELTF
ncbi:hypothetical protein A6A04_11090 [Paramagnetospirillum marisnigri]|uniref:N-acetyltransferase domain-containing protein n=1 Tax=Paramagnetospirillum marisnigri TaxID=1285242 RepID=A0A178MXE9_9PROT|nr:GNAT family N-acetyltransferase [Paramagnetospirillum marisnigri]OAN55203.1 hypothetical protein A6A04_11090 [Paramagnetospirillum marisnigri]